MCRALRRFLLLALFGSACALPLLPAAAQTTPSDPAVGTGDGAPLGLGGPEGESLDPEIQSLIEEAERTRPVPSQLLNDLAIGNGDPDAMINEFLSQGNASPRTVAVRAIALSLAVGRDPRLKDSDRRFALTQAIGDGMSKTLGAPRILNVEVEADFVPPEGTFAWDLGGLETPVANGFQQLTPFSSEVRGFGMQDQDDVGDGEVLQDVIENLQSVTLNVPNGQYRVILVTAAELAARSENPFGEVFKVNGVEYFLGRSNVADWLETAYLRGAGDAVADGISYGAAGLSVVVEVGNGTLTLEFEGGRSSLGSIISGIVLEPVELPSRLDYALDQELLQQFSLDSLVELEFQTQAAIATVSGVSPAAGPTGPVAPQPGTTPGATPAPPPPVFVSNSGASPAS